MPRLSVLNGKRQGATFDVGRAGAVIGHRNTAPISIDDPWVSWDHARIFLQNDAFWIEDLGSTNGTFVNCVRIKRERLNHEDIVFFGKTHVIFLVPEAASSTGGGGASDEKKRSSFEVGVEAVAAAAQWTAPTSPVAAAGPPWKNGKNGRPPSQSTGPALPVGPGELAPLGPGLLEPGEDSSRSRRDPFRPGADPWDQNSIPTPPTQRGSSALANLDPSADPFASARAEQQAQASDPFSVGQDPNEGQRQRSHLETHHDADKMAPPSSGARPTAEDGAFSKRPRPGFENFDIDEDEPDQVGVSPVSAGEISSLIEGKKSNDGDDGGLDDLDALLGDAAARTPPPGVFKVDPTKNSAARAALDMGGPPIGSARFKNSGVAPLPPPQRSATGRLPEASALGAARTQPLSVPPPSPASSGASSAGLSAADLAFEVAKLQDEVRRLRMALDGARQADPEKVRVAVEGLRAEELGRQAREIAELRRDLASVKGQFGKTQAELDEVTAEMIDKEDQIESLKKQLAQRAPAPGSPGF